MTLCKKLVPKIIDYTEEKFLESQYNPSNK